MSVRPKRALSFALVGLLGACGADAPAVAPAATNLCAAPARPESLALHTDHGLFRDAQGREVRLRGVNAGSRSKFPPFVPFAFGDADAQRRSFEVALADYFDRVVDWGLNVVRLPFTWEAVEPVRGQYDAAFLARLDALIAAAGERGVRVIVDMHQDVFARPYCGDGFPLWTMADPATPMAQDCSQWFQAYFSSAAMRTDFDRFWSGADGLMTAFEAMWTMIATRYADTDAVIGYEIINEPGWGTADEDEFSETVLTAFYTRMVGVVRAVAPAKLVFIGPTGFDGVFGETTLQRPVGDGLVFAPHFYDAGAFAGMTLPDEAALEAKLAGWRDVGVAWDVPVLLGEFGVAYDAEGAAPYMRAHWGALEALGIHGTQWEYSVTGEDWNAESMSVVDADGRDRALAAELMRVYPAAIRGSLRDWHFDRAARAAEFTLEQAANGSSSFVTPRGLFPEGVTVRVLADSAGDGCAAWDAAAGLVRVGGTGTVRISIAPAIQ
jgi:endoglycosylceramidase